MISTARHTIPVTPSVADSTFGVTLDDLHYTMHVYWNGKDQAWYFDLSKAGSATPLISGVKIVLGAFLGRVVQEPPFTTGVFAIVDTSGNKQDPGFDDLGARVRFYWVPQAVFLANISSL